LLDLPEIQSCRLASGRQLAWREWGAGQPLIMLHGWSMSSVVFSEVAEILAARHRVLCPDLPGHGTSDSLVDCDLKGFAAAIAEWAALLGVESADLLGWSLGGQVALQLAADRRLSLEKLLLISTTPKFCAAGDWSHGLPETQLKTLERNLVRAFEKTLGDFFNLQFVSEDLPKERYRQILKFAVRSGNLPQPKFAREALRLLGAADLRALLDHIVQPTLVMHGELDQIIPVGAGSYLAERLPNAELARMEEIGHAPFFSRPDESVKLWRAFLQ